MHPDIIREEVLKSNPNISQCEYVRNLDDTYSFVFRIAGKRFGGRLKTENGEITKERAQSFIFHATHTKL